VQIVDENRLAGRPPVSLHIASVICLLVPAKSLEAKGRGSFSGKGRGSFPGCKWSQAGSDGTEEGGYWGPYVVIVSHENT
jgi:hypothetical protein